MGWGVLWTVLWWEWPILAIVAAEAFLAKDPTLRGMVELECGTAHADMLRAGHGGFNAGNCEGEQHGN